MQQLVRGWYYYILTVSEVSKDTRGRYFVEVEGGVEEEGRGGRRRETGR